jgi:HAD superfamily hydrolase (TIGR01509 family)
MPPIRAVIFDFNGVLVDDEHVHFELFREVLAAEGIALDEAAYHDRYLGFDDRGCFSAALIDSGRAAPTDLVDALIARKAIRYTEVAETSLRFFPSAAETVRALSEVYPVAICSGALRTEIEYALKRMGIRDCVASITSAEDTERCKPDPEGYLIALDRLRSGFADLDAGSCLVIEDSLAGVEAARAAGMVAVGVTNTYSAEELKRAGAGAVVERLGMLTSSTVGDPVNSPPGMEPEKSLPACGGGKENLAQK